MKQAGSEWHPFNRKVFLRFVFNRKVFLRFVWKEEETLKMPTTHFLKLWSHVWLCLQGNATGFLGLSACVRRLTQTGRDSMRKDMHAHLVWVCVLGRHLWQDLAVICEITLPAWRPWGQRWRFWLSWRIPALVKLIFQILQNHFLVLPSFSSTVLGWRCFPGKREGKKSSQHKSTVANYTQLSADGVFCFSWL